MNRQREFGFLVSASLHGVLLIAIMGWPSVSSQSFNAAPRRNDPTEVEIIDLSDLRDHAFNFDVAKIASRGSRLFPFTDPILLSPASKSIQAAGRDSDSRVFVLESHLAKPSPALRLTALELQALLDESWSRRERWDSFQRILDIVQRCDPQEGDLSILLRRYENDNVLQPLNASHNTEPKLWALLSIAADHLNFVQFISNFVRRVPSSKSTTELLFLLDKLIQANLNAVLEIFKLDPLDGLQWTSAVSPSGARTLLALHTYHKRALNQRGMWNESALTHQYDEARLLVLQHLIRTTPHGYRVNDARFLIGELYWQQGRVNEALKIWGDITPAATDEYSLVSSEVLSAIGTKQISRERIAFALNAQTRRWIHASYLRLRHFGFQLDTF
jgi:hypothetical protein